MIGEGSRDGNGKHSLVKRLYIHLGKRLVVPEIGKWIDLGEM